MTIYGKSGGAVKELSPRVKHNGVIKTPVSGWTKQNGVIKKIWSSFVPVSSITIDGDTTPSFYDRYGGTITYTVTISPANATNKEFDYEIVPDGRPQGVYVSTKNSSKGDNWIKVAFVGANDYVDGSFYDHFTLTVRAKDGSGVVGHLDITTNI